MVNKQIPCAIIGLGRIGSTLEDDVLREKPASHAGAIAHNPETLLVAGCDIEEEQRKAFGERWGLTALYEDAGRMIDEVRPEILHISTHDDSHLSYLELAIRRKVPVVVLEKPVSDRLRPVRRMLKRLQASETRVVVNHERRYSRDYLMARKHIRQKTFGHLLSVHGKVFMGHNNPVGNILLHDGTHMLDIISFLTGSRIENISTGKRRTGDLHTLYVQGRSGDVSVLCEIGNSRDHLVFELELSFIEGLIRIGNGVYEEWSSEPSPYYEKFRSLINRESPPLGNTNYFAGMMADAVRLVRSPESPAISSFKDGLDSLEVITKVRQLIG